MRYKKVDVSEQSLEDLVRRHADQIEEGLVYVEHQKAAAGGRLDVLFVDSGKSLVVAELKITEEDGMLLQGIDYYDYVTAHVESYARLYRDQAIDPTQQVRLFLIAPSFSQVLVNRCKWFDIPISLFTYNCLKFHGNDDVVPIFAELPIPTPPEPVEATPIEDHIAYITDAPMRSKFVALLEELKNWKPGRIAVDSIKYAISIKVDGRVFAYLHPRRHHYLVGTFNAEDKWTDYSVRGDDELAEVKLVVKAAMERKLKG